MGASRLEQMLFATRADFRAWLAEHGAASGGVWLVLGKQAGPATLSAGEALQEALCFGWIDGRMQSIDQTKYMKYFAPRRKGSNWSPKNKKLAAELEAQGLMTDRGRAKIEEAKSSGAWDAPEAGPISQAQVMALENLIKPAEPAFTHFMAMPPSAKRAYTGLYFDAKSEEARARRLEKIIRRLNLNLNPMEREP